MPASREARRNAARPAARLVIVANRLPVQKSRSAGAGWQRSPGGLVSAMTPVLERTGGAWVGWSGAAGPAPPAFRHEGIRIHPVGLSTTEVDRFYQSFSNRTLWPLYHDALRPPEYDERWWASYRKINERFARTAGRLLRDGDVAWVHDYHLQLVPALLRRSRPHARIGFFLHIPFPPEELFAQLPWRRELLEGPLGADVIGFQTSDHAENFARLARRHAGATGRNGVLRYQGREVRVAAFPIAPDVARYEALAASRDVILRADQLRRRLGPERKVLLGVDRLDYTKGIDSRLSAYEQALRQRRLGVDNCVLVQVAVPSRDAVIEYVQVRRRIDELVGRINGGHGEPGRVAVHYLRRNLPLAELVAFYRMADVMLVTPFRDGMNLVAKEYVASRTDDSGVLVLSEFAGAAHELDQALLVNPHSRDQVADAMVSAVRMPEAEAARRMAALRQVVRSHDVHAWADEFLGALRPRATAA